MSVQHKHKDEQPDAKLLDDAFQDGFLSVFDPAAGSGNFLLEALKMLMTEPAIDVSHSISDDLETDAENLANDLLYLTNDAKAATEKLLNKKHP